MKIGELSKQTGVPTPLLRYYEKRGLLVPGRSENGFRCYDRSSVGRVLTIRRLLDAGLTTLEIAVLLPYLGTGSEPNTPMTPAVRQLLHNELRRLDGQIAFLGRARAALGRRLGLTAVSLQHREHTPMVDARTGAAGVPTPARTAVASVTRRSALARAAD